MKLEDACSPNQALCSFFADFYDRNKKEELGNDYMKEKPIFNDKF